MPPKKKKVLAVVKIQLPAGGATPAPPVGTALGPHGVQIFFVRREQGRLSELEPLIRMLLEFNPTEAMWGPGLVLLLAEIGMHDEGVALLERLTRDQAAAIPRDMLFPAALCMLAEAAFLLGRPEPVELLETELQPWAAAGIPLGGTVSFVGAATRYLGLLAWLSDRHESASIGRQKKEMNIETSHGSAIVPENFGNVAWYQRGSPVCDDVRAPRGG